MAEWHDPASLRATWADAPSSDALVQELLEVAKQQVLAFAPELTLAEDGEPDAEPAPPANYRMAQAYQARALYQASKANVNADVDVVGGEFKVRVYPMDWNIKNMLRPQRGVPSVG